MNRRQQLIAELKDYRTLGYEVLVKLNASTDKLQAELDRLELEINGVTSCELTCDVIGYDKYIHGLDYEWNNPALGVNHSYAWKGATSELPTGANKDLGSQCGGVTGNDLNQSEVVINSSTTLSDNNDTGNQYAAVLGGQQQKQGAVSEPLPGLSKPFNYEQELAKLKSLSRQEFMQLIKFTQHVKNFSSYYVPKTEVLQSYLSASEWDQVLEDTNCDAWLKLVEVENCFTEAGNYHFSQMISLESSTGYK